MSALLMSAIRRLEQDQNDDAISCIDLRGKHSSETLEESSVPHPEDVLRLTRAIQSYSCRLKVLSMHTNFLGRRDIPALFDVLVDLPLIEKLVIFHHDLADDMVGLLLHALTGSGVKSDEKLDTFIEKDAHESESTQSQSSGLKELYLSHCNIGCIGASRIADALLMSSIPNRGRNTENNRLRYLRVLSLGSNRIKKDGAASLAKAFGLCPLHRLVLHGNKDLGSSDTNDLYRYALTPEGWQQCAVMPCSDARTEDRSKLHATPMALIAPLISDYVRNRWVTDHVLVRPYDLARKRLLEEIYKIDSSYVDDRIDKMPEILSWMGRVGTCSRPPNRQSQLGNTSEEKTPLFMRHSDGCKECQACKNIHLNDVYKLMRRMPHLAERFRNLSFYGPRV